MVICDHTKCVGCWMCVMACPYGVIKRRKEDRVALKCDQCLELDEPACVAACPTAALYFCEKDEFVEIIDQELNKGRSITPDSLFMPRK